MNSLALPRPWIRRLLMSAALLCVVGLGFAQARPHGRHGRDGGLLKPEAVDRLAAQLSLDPAVTQRLKEKLHAVRLETIAVKAQLKAAQRTVREQLAQETPDRAAVMAALDAVGAARTALRKLKTGALLDVRAELTPEQRAKLKTLRGAYSGRRARRARGGEGRRPDRDDGDGPPAPPPPDDDDD